MGSRWAQLAVIGWIAWAQPWVALALEVPAHTGLVVDQAQILSPELRVRLEKSLRRFNQEVGPQIQLLTIPSLEGQAIEAYSIRVVDQWKLGGAKMDDGAMLLVAPKDRQMRIEVGQGLEGSLPDVTAGRIISEVIAPRFKEGRFEEGIVAGLQTIAQRAGGELNVEGISTNSARSRSSTRGHREGFGIGLFPLLIFGFLILPLFRRRRRSQFDRAPRGGGLVSGLILGSLLSGRRRSGGGFGAGGFGGGGTFGGGGGGGFSGGGASGRW